MICLRCHVDLTGPNGGALRYHRVTWTVPKKPTTVLIVENEAIVRMELTGRLAAMGLTVLAAADADAAIALLDAHPEIELLMTDIIMPGSMDGEQLAHHARWRWPPLKIIVASGQDGPRADLPPGVIFLPKPFWPEPLSAALDQMINGGGPRLPQPLRRSRA